MKKKKDVLKNVHTTRKTNKLTCDKKAPVAIVNTATRKYGDRFKPVAQ